MTQTGGVLDALNDPAGEVIDAQWVELKSLQDVLAHENERRMAQLAMEIIE
jgi:hypothetical protein